MGKRKGALTPMQRVFSANLARSGDPAYSAEKAGYSAPGTLGPRMAANPDVMEDQRRRARHLLMTKGAEVGVNVLIELASDLTQKGSTRGAAAKSLVQLSGIQNAAAMSPEDLAELPADQIRALLAEAQRALQARLDKLNTIDHEPTPIEPEAPQSAQPAPNLFD